MGAVVLVTLSEVGFVSVHAGAVTASTVVVALDVGKSSAVLSVTDAARCRERGRVATPPLIGNDVWIGRDSMIMPGVHVGDGAIVAKPLKRRFSGEDIDLLQCIAWSKWPIDSITEHVREIWAGTPADLERTARKAGLLD